MESPESLVSFNVRSKATIRMSPAGSRFTLFENGPCGGSAMRNEGGACSRNGMGPGSAMITGPLPRPYTPRGVATAMGGGPSGEGRS